MDDNNNNNIFKWFPVDAELRTSHEILTMEHSSSGEIRSHSSRSDYSSGSKLSWGLARALAFKIDRVLYVVHRIEIRWVGKPSVFLVLRANVRWNVHYWFSKCWPVHRFRDISTECFFVDFYPSIQETRVFCCWHKFSLRSSKISDPCVKSFQSHLVQPMNLERNYSTNYWGV